MDVKERMGGKEHLHIHKNISLPLGLPAVTFVGLELYSRKQRALHSDQSAVPIATSFLDSGRIIYKKID